MKFSATLRVGSSVHKHWRETGRIGAVLHGAVFTLVCGRRYEARDVPDDVVERLHADPDVTLELMTESVAATAAPIKMEGAFVSAGVAPIPSIEAVKRKPGRPAKVTTA